MPLTEDATIERIFPALLSGDRAAALAQLDERLRAGATPEQLREEVLRPLQSMLARLRQSGQVTTEAHDGAALLIDDLQDQLAIPLVPLSEAPPAAAPPASRFVTCRFGRGVLTLQLAGPSLNEREARIAGEEIQGQVRRHGHDVRTIVLDFTEVQMMSSIGLNLCIDVRNMARGLGARTIAYGLRRELRKLFSLTRVNRLYEMPRTREELRRALAV
jgi:anti-anti-sigma regulatory factor